MTIYILTTNEGTTYVRSTNARLRKAMHNYLRYKRLSGLTASQIIFTWAPIVVGTI